MIPTSEVIRTESNDERANRVIRSVVPSSLQPKSGGERSNTGLGSFQEAPLTQLIVENPNASNVRNTEHTASQSQTGVADADIGIQADTSLPASRYTEMSTQDQGFLERMFQEAFGASPVNTEGGPDSATRAIWWDAVSLRGKQYARPDGNAGTRFVLADEIESCNTGRQPSEREFIFTSLVLQHNKAVCKAKDIRPMLMRRMNGHVGKRTDTGTPLRCPAL